MPALTPEAIETLAQQYFRQRQEEYEDIHTYILGKRPFKTPSPSTPETAKERLKSKRDKYLKLYSAGSLTEDIWNRTEKLLKEHGYDASLQPMEERRLAEMVLIAEIERMNMLLARLNGDYAGAGPQHDVFKRAFTLPPMQFTPSYAVHPSATPPQSDPARKLSRLLQTYQEAKSNSEAWTSSKTIIKNESAHRLMQEIFGDKDVRLITLEDGRRFRDIIARMPSNLQKKRKPGDALKDHLLPAGAKGGLAPSTAKFYFTAATAFFTWCKSEGYTDTIPLPEKSNLKRDKENPKDKCLPYTMDELQAFFNSPQFTGHDGPWFRSKPGKSLLQDSRYWVPIISLFSGMRMGEILQLYVEDVYQENGVWLFNVNKGESEEKKVKTAVSVRRVPMHRQLRKLGFLDYLNEQEKKPKARLFPDALPAKSTGYYSDTFSKLFAYYMRSTKLKKPKKTFHSFRHTFKQALVEKEVSEEISHALMGHSGDDVHEIYGGDISIELLAKNLNKVSYNIDLSHLEVKP